MEINRQGVVLFGPFKGRHCVGMNYQEVEQQNKWELETADTANTAGAWQTDWTSFPGWSGGDTLKTTPQPPPATQEYPWDNDKPSIREEWFDKALKEGFGRARGIDDRMVRVEIMDDYHEENENMCLYEIFVVCNETLDLVFHDYMCGKNREDVTRKSAVAANDVIADGLSYTWKYVTIMEVDEADED